jgi:hypothetical protein
MLTRATDLDEVGRRRCLLVLSVLSGQKPVTDAIAEAEISRPLYYQLEEKAVRAMVTALTPGAVEDTSGRGLAPAARIVQLERRIGELERDNRRNERLLLVTRKVLRGPMKTQAGRPPKAKVAVSTSAGRKRLRVSKPKLLPEGTASSPTPDGEGGA